MARTATNTSSVITATASHERMPFSLGHARVDPHRLRVKMSKECVQPSCRPVGVIDGIPSLELRREARLRPAVEVEQHPHLASARREESHANCINTREGHDRHARTCSESAASRQDALSGRRACAGHRVLHGGPAQQHGDAANHHEQQRNDEDELRQSKLFSWWMRVGLERSQAAR